MKKSMYNIFNFIKQLLKEFQMTSKSFKYTLYFLVIISFTLGILIGCTSVSESYVTTNYKNSQDLFPDFIQYINTDNNITAEDKEIRIKAIKEWQSLNEEMFLHLSGKKK